MTDGSDTLAVVIGIARHEQTRLDLRTPDRDARDLELLLRERLGWRTILLCNEETTLGRLKDLLEREMPEKTNENSRVLVYFAGHGLVTDSQTQPKAYLVPHDARNDEASLLPMEAVSTALQELRCKHVLVILDCCFAAAFRWRSGRDFGAVLAPELYRERYELFLRRPAWQIITSAAADQKAADVLAGMPFGARGDAGVSRNSPFASALLRGLGGEADMSPPGGDGVITATELYLFVREEIEREIPHGNQTPGLWTLDRHEQGEFIFHVHGREVLLRDAPALARENSPYRGLQPYEEKDAKLLFGRAAVVDALFQRVETSPLTVVVAVSGAGKSSVVKAGLLPLHRKMHPDSLVELTRPSSSGDGAIERALARGAQALLIVDQLEEVFALDRNVAFREEYLASLVRARAAGVHIVATLRSDFEAQFASGALSDGWTDARFVLGEMSRDELRQVVELPANRAVLFFDPPSLVDRLVDAVVGSPGALPLLSFVLTQLYERLLRRADGSRMLRESEYDELGGITGALQARLERVHTDLGTEEDRATLKAVLLRMVELEGGGVVRRSVQRDELTFGEPWDRRVQHVWGILTSAEARLATGGGDASTGKLELVHDAVVRSWPRFDEWIRDRRVTDGVHLERRVSAAERDWREANRDARRLWHADVRLNVAVRQAADPLGFNARERAFVGMSSRKRRIRRLTVSLLVAIAVTSVAVTFVRSLLAQGEADRQALLANEARLAERRRAIGERGALAANTASFAGRAGEALALGIGAVGEALELGEAVPPSAIDGLAAAIGASGQLVGRAMPHRGEDPRIWGVACSQDGELVVSVSSDATVFTRRDGEEIARLTRSDEHGTEVGSGGFAVAAAGQWFLTGNDGVMKLWTDEGQVHALADAGGSLTGLALDRSGTRVVGTRLDGRVVVWLPDAHTPASTVAGHDTKDGDLMQGLAAAITVDGTRAATSGYDKAVRLWKIEEADGIPSLVSLCTFATTFDPRGLDFTPDGSRLVAAGGSGWTVVDVSNCAPAEAPAVVVAQDTLLSQPRDAVFSLDGLDVITGGHDGILQRWDARSGRRLASMVRTQREITAVDRCGQGSYALGDVEGVVSIHHETGDAAYRTISTAAKPQAVVFTSAAADALAVATDAEQGGVQLVRLDGTEPRSLEGAPMRPWTIAVSADGKQLRAVGRDGQLSNWDTTTGAQLAVTPLESIGRASASRDGTRLAAIGASGLLIWDGAGAELGRVALQPDFTNLMIAPALSDDGSRVAAYDASSKRVRVWTSTDQGEVRAFPSPSVPTSLSLAPDGSALIIGGADGVVRLGDVTSGAVKQELLAHTSEVWATAFSPNAKRFVTAGGDKVVRVWDRATGAQIAALPGSSARVFALAFAADSETIAAACHDNRVRLFSVSPRRLLTIACERARGYPPVSEIPEFCKKNGSQP